jgi:hypothetical protein
MASSPHSAAATIMWTAQKETSGRNTICRVTPSTITRHRPTDRTARSRTKVSPGARAHPDPYNAPTHACRFCCWRGRLQRRVDHNDRSQG